MKGGVFDRSECCNEPCECPVCLENKPLMRLNCNHYVCLEDIQHIIQSNPRRLQKCPICREIINSYGCNGNIINLENNQNQQMQINVIPNEEENNDNVNPPLIINNDYYFSNSPYNIVSDNENSDDEYSGLYGGIKRNRKRMKSKHRHRHRKKITKRRINSKRRHTRKITNKRKTIKK